MSSYANNYLGQIIVPVAVTKTIDPIKKGPQLTLYPGDEGYDEAYQKLLNSPGAKPAKDAPIIVDAPPPILHTLFLTPGETDFRDIDMPTGNGEPTKPRIPAWAINTALAAGAFGLVYFLNR